MASDTDPLWDRFYREVFIGPELDVPFFALRGNHDMHRNPAAEIDYHLNKRDSRWVMPSANYTISERLCEDGASGCVNLDFVNIDTSTLALEANEPEVQLPPNATDVVAQQLQWIEDTLSRSSADFLVVSRGPGGGGRGGGRHTLTHSFSPLQRWRVITASSLKESMATPRI